MLHGVQHSRMFVLSTTHNNTHTIMTTAEIKTQYEITKGAVAFEVHENMRIGSIVFEPCFVLESNVTNCALMPAFMFKCRIQFNELESVSIKTLGARKRRLYTSKIARRVVNVCKQHGFKSSKIERVYDSRNGLNVNIILAQ